MPELPCPQVPLEFGATQAQGDTPVCADHAWAGRKCHSAQGQGTGKGASGPAGEPWAWSVQHHPTKRKKQRQTNTTLKISNMKYIIQDIMKCRNFILGNYRKT